MGAAASAAADQSGQMGRRHRPQHAGALLLLMLTCQLAGQLCAAFAAADSEAAEPPVRKHITLRGRIRGGGIYSTAVGKSNSALQQLLAEYLERHEAVLRAPTEQPQKYVVSAMSDSYGGLGNQLPIMVNGFLLALLTNRTFFIDYPLHEQFFTHTLDLNWSNHEARLPDRGALLVKELKYEQPFGSDFYLTTDFGAPEWLAKDIIQIFCDGDYEAAPLMSNRNYAAFRERYFPSGEVFHPLAEWLLRTKPEFQAKVDAVKREKFRPFTVGLQIRKWKGHGEGGFNWAPPPSLKAFASAAKALQRQRGLPDRDVAFFIASDAAEVYDEAAQLLGAEQVIRTNNGVGTANWNGNPGSPETAILDWKLLTECDDLIITVGSSFGQIAAAYAGITPVNLVHGEHANVHNPYFFRAINSEPCYYGSKGVLKHASEESKAALQDNPLWFQYASCH